MSVRFAPSPTGRFHVGNLRTAWIAHRLAQSLAMPLRIRFEDIDGPRVQPAALESQWEDMLALGLKLSKPYLLQSLLKPRHWELFWRAVDEGRVYPCSCSRSQLQSSLASAPHKKLALYNGHCRNLLAAELAPAATISWRIKAAESSGQNDFIVARTQSLEPSFESFVPSYQWACAIDDFDGRHELLVRAADLKDSAPKQRLIFELLSEWESKRAYPAIFHCALITQNDGHRLEKRSLGVTLPEILASGLTVEYLLELFEASFSLEARDFEESKLFGESRETMTLGELGLS